MAIIVSIEQIAFGVVADNIEVEPSCPRRWLRYLGRRGKERGALTTGFAGLIFAVAIYMLYQSGRAIGLV
jgi:hypothetical protein